MNIPVSSVGRSCKHNLVIPFENGLRYIGVLGRGSFEIHIISFVYLYNGGLSEHALYIIVFLDIRAVGRKAYNSFYVIPVFKVFALRVEYRVERSRANPPHFIDIAVFYHGVPPVVNVVVYHVLKVYVAEF